MSYESPINITEIASQIAEAFDAKTQTYIIKTLANYGINVSSCELMRALKYDRNQYEKGYKDGRKAVIKLIEKWQDQKTGGEYSFELITDLLEELNELIGGE